MSDARCHGVAASSSVLALLLCTSACFDPSLPDGIACGPMGECPAATHCEATTSTCVPDALPSVASLQFVGFPASVEALAPVPAFTIEFVDSSGKRVAVSGAKVHLSVAENVSGTKVIGGAEGTAIDGVVEFVGVRLEGPGRELTLVAHAGDLAATSGTFAVTFSRPVISFPSGSGEVAGCASIAYTLKQAQGHPVDLAVEVDADGPDGPAPFQRARQAASAPGMAGIQGAPSTALGREQAFSWNTSADLPGIDADATLRITPSIDGVVGLPALRPVSVRNGPRWMRSQAASIQASSLLVDDLDRDGWPDIISLDAQTLAVRWGIPGARRKSPSMCRPATWRWAISTEMACSTSLSPPRAAARS